MLSVALAVYRFFIASDNPSRAAMEQRAMVGVLSGYEDQILQFFYDKTRELMVRESYSLVGVKTRSLDIVRDVLKYIPLHWASSFFVSTCRLPRMVKCLCSRCCDRAA